MYRFFGAALAFPITTTSGHVHLSLHQTSRLRAILRGVGFWNYASLPSGKQPWYLSSCHNQPLFSQSLMNCSVNAVCLRVFSSLPLAIMPLGLTVWGLQLQLKDLWIEAPTV